MDVLEVGRLEVGRLEARNLEARGLEAAEGRHHKSWHSSVWHSQLLTSKAGGTGKVGGGRVAVRCGASKSAVVVARADRLAPASAHKGGGVSTGGAKVWFFSWHIYPVIMLSS